MPTHHRARALALTFLALAACTRASTVASTGATSPDITEADLRHRLFLIADDSMMGRMTGSEGAQKATEYIASEFRRFGLEPMGENGTFFQTMPAWRVGVDSQSRLEIDGDTLKVGRDFFPSWVTAAPRTLHAVSVMLGGAATDSSTWISDAQARGKLVLVDFPTTGAGTVTFDARRWPSAAAVGLVRYERITPASMGRLRNGFVVNTQLEPAAVPVVQLTRDAATRLLGAAPQSLRPGAVGRTARGFIALTRDPVAFPARNVVAVLRGSDPARRGQYVALTAHNDHVGFDHSPVDHDSLRAFNEVVRPMGADSPVRPPTAEETARIRTILDSLRRVHRPRLDSIYNGADDDGSGTVSILEIAERMALGRERPRRSVLFVSHTAEEMGLLGSKWYSEHPTVARDSIVAEIDQDMIGRGTSRDFPRGGTGAGSDTYLEVIGAKRLSRAFGEMMEAANARQPIPFVFDYTYDQPGHPLRYYCRADHYSYARYGIPSLALSRGEHLDYHQVTDEAQYISYRDLARVSRMVHDGALAIANADQRPALDVPKPTDPNAPCRQ